MHTPKLFRRPGLCLVRVCEQFGPTAEHLCSLTGRWPHPRRRSMLPKGSGSNLLNPGATVRKPPVDSGKQVLQPLPTGPHLSCCTHFMYPTCLPCFSHKGRFYVCVCVCVWAVPGAFSPASGGRRGGWGTSRSSVSLQRSGGRWDDLVLVCSTSWPPCSSGACSTVPAERCPAFRSCCMSFMSLSLWPDEKSSRPVLACRCANRWAFSCVGVFA